MYEIFFLSSLFAFVWVVLLRSRTSWYGLFGGGDMDGLVSHVHFPLPF